MKCPKCGYLGFEPVDRCRNCGYDFSLSPSADLPELPIRAPDRDVGPLDDLALRDLGAPSGSRRLPSEVSPDFDRVFAASQPGAVPSSPSELPLFAPRDDDDAPLITRVSPPRPPLAVRRATPEVPRLRSTDSYRAPMLDLTVPEPAPPALPPPSRAQAREVPRAAGGEPAGLAARSAAALIDLLILAVIDAGVVYLTMQICGVTLEELELLPKGPLVAFLVVQNVGYLVAFTAGGQTLGKMATGIRVVPAAPDTALDLSHSLVRTLVWLLLAIPAGLGLVPALFAADRRGLHDRCAGTRVVRAGLA